MMMRALTLAGRGMFSAHPNPRVGCVLARDGEIVGEGWHQKTGESHAEINALTDAGNAAEGSIAYVTLEPCSHHGKTPPCADALVQAGVKEVFVAMEDPNTLVSGDGLKALRAADIKVHTGLMQDAAIALNEGFVSRMSRGIPLVRLKIAASLDGATAMKTGESKWITGEESRRDVQRLRASSGAILTGVETVLQDDPSLTVRGEFTTDIVAQPLRVVLDSSLRTPTSAKMLELPGTTIIYCVDDRNREALEQAGATVKAVKGKDGRPDLDEILGNLAELGVNDVLVEAGPTLAGAFFMEKRVDELVIYQAPHIMGSETRGMVKTPSWLNMDQRFELEITEASVIGRDMVVTARPAK